MSTHDSDMSIEADYTRTPLGMWRITVTSDAGQDTVEGSGRLPDVVEDTVMPVVQLHTDRLGGPCFTIHTLDGDTSAFMAAYEADGGDVAGETLIPGRDSE